MRCLPTPYKPLHSSRHNRNSNFKSVGRGYAAPLFLSRRITLQGILFPVTLSVVIISHNEEVNIGRTLESVKPLVRDGKGEIIVVDSGSTDHTVEIAESHGAKVFIEEWKGYAAQKNSAIEKAWVMGLSLDADEELDQ